MANIPFTHQTISNGVTQASAGTMQTVFDAIRMIVDKTGYRSTYVLDADTVSGYGIGVPSVAMVASVDNYVNNGWYYDPAGLTNSPWGATASANILVFRPDSSNYYMYQLAFKVVTGTNLPQVRVRTKTISGWQPWQEIWTPGSDGNQAQPPAPKPSASPAGGADASGQFYSGATSGGNVYMGGAASRTGTWKLRFITFVTATGVVNLAKTNTVISASAGAIVVPTASETTVWDTVRLS